MGEKVVQLGEAGSWTAVSMISVYHFASPKKFLVMILGVGSTS